MTELLQCISWACIREPVCCSSFQECGPRGPGVIMQQTLASHGISTSPSALQVLIQVQYSKCTP